MYPWKNLMSLKKRCISVTKFIFSTCDLHLIHKEVQRRRRQDMWQIENTNWAIWKWNKEWKIPALDWKWERDRHSRVSHGRDCDCEVSFCVICEYMKSWHSASSFMNNNMRESSNTKGSCFPDRIFLNVLFAIILKL
jgi:hypothetical protein